VSLLLLALAASAPRSVPPSIAAPPAGPIVETGPHWSGDPDLCINTATATREDGTTFTVHFYRIIGDGAVPDALTPAFAAEQVRRCAAAGPIERPDRTGPHFFQLMDSTNPIDGIVAVRILRRAMREAAAGTYSDIECDPRMSPGSEAPECEDPRRALASLDLAGLDMVELSTSEGGIISLEAGFNLGSADNLTLQIEAVPSGSPEGNHAFRLGHARFTSLRRFDVVDEPPPPSD
jgi:hypothetical protein